MTQAENGQPAPPRPERATTQRRGKEAPGGRRDGRRRAGPSS